MIQSRMDTRQSGVLGEILRGGLSYHDSTARKPTLRPKEGALLPRIRRLCTCEESFVCGMCGALRYAESTQRECCRLRTQIAIPWTYLGTATSTPGMTVRHFMVPALSASSDVRSRCEASVLSHVVTAPGWVDPAFSFHFLSRDVFHSMAGSSVWRQNFFHDLRGSCHWSDVKVFSPCV